MNGEWQEYTQEFTDEETGIHITVKYDIPDYPLIIVTMPDGYVLTDKGNETLKRLLAQAGLPKGAPARLGYLGECTHHGKLWDMESEIDLRTENEQLRALLEEASTLLKDAVDVTMYGDEALGYGDEGSGYFNMVKAEDWEERYQAMLQKKERKGTKGW